MKKIDKEIMEEISSKLMIDLTDSEIQIIMDEVSKSISDLETVKSMKLDGVEPTNFVNIQVNNDFREDVVVEFENKEKLLKCAKEIEKGLVKV